MNKRRFSDSLRSTLFPLVEVTCKEPKENCWRTLKTKWMKLNQLWKAIFGKHCKWTVGYQFYICNNNFLLKLHESEEIVNVYLLSLYFFLFPYNPFRAVRCPRVRLQQRRKINLLYVLFNMCISIWICVICYSFYEQIKQILIL